MLTKLKKSNYNLVFRFGLGLIFLTNSLTAWFSPDEFKELVTNNYLASKLANPSLLVTLIGINDALLFIFIISGKWRKFVAIWAGLWILVVIFVTGIKTPDFVFHLGVLSLIIYYYFAKQ